MSGALIAMLLFLTIDGSLLVPLLGGFVGGFGLPQWILGRLIKRRQNKFIDEFANAIDVIVRGVKSGLPLTECLAIIGRESAEPVAGESTSSVSRTTFRASSRSPRSPWSPTRLGTLTISRRVTSRRARARRGSWLPDLRRRRW
ncbi:hypothetical protein G6O46_23570 [Salmonella enterica subsp. enterica serovar Enteritidis]|nr:hypothetical protein [Salmonella enterica subsp. enterica serovar Enteritidis]